MLGVKELEVGSSTMDKGESGARSMSLSDRGSGCPDVGSNGRPGGGDRGLTGERGEVGTGTGTGTRVMGVNKDRGAFGEGKQVCSQGVLQNYRRT